MVVPFGGIAVPHNIKQSPFGTNVDLYDSITKFSFCDYDTKTVKVYRLIDIDSAI